MLSQNELTRHEQLVVQKLKIFYFGAFLQTCWLRADWLKEIPKGKIPKRSDLVLLLKDTRSYRLEFIIVYEIELPECPVNPLTLEQKAWKLLSPQINHFEAELRQFLETYHKGKLPVDELLRILKSGWALVQKWNVISESYKPKYEGEWHKIPETENALKKLIEELSR